MEVAMDKLPPSGYFVLGSMPKFSKGIFAFSAICIAFGAIHLLHRLQIIVKHVQISTKVEPKRDTLNVSLNNESCVNNSLAPLNWCIDNEFHKPRFVGRDEDGDVWPPKTIQLYSSEGYEACLANKVIVFIGDSRVRYQFLNLAGFLKYRKFMRCNDYPSGYERDETCVLINEQMRNNWNIWYQDTTEILQEASKQYSLCDCHRPRVFTANKSYENRYIHRFTQFGDIKLVYLQNFEDLIRIDKEFPPFSTSYFPSGSQCKVGECGQENRTNAFEGNLEKTVWEVLPKLKATHAFVSAGWTRNPKRLSHLSCILEEFQLHQQGIQAFLISNPYPATTKKPIVFESKKLNCRCNVFDRAVMSKAVPREWYWDSLHPWSILNEEFNHQLIKSICPI